MFDFLNAEQAKRIANSELSQVMSMIEKCAYDGGLKIDLDYYLSPDTVKTLEYYGYKVEQKKISIYHETPYGNIEDNPSGYKKQTTISWK